MAKTISDNDYFVLTALIPDPLHGYEIVKEIDRRTSGNKKLSLASLYDAIRRLESAELIVLLDDKEIFEGRVRKTYRISDSGGDAVADKERLLAQMRAASKSNPQVNNLAFQGEPR